MYEQVKIWLVSYCFILFYLFLNIFKWYINIIHQFILKENNPIILN